MSERRQFKPSDHTFVVCAYGESPYLEVCIQSLKAQKIRTNIIMTTSTPSAFFSDLAEKYNIPLIINEKKIGKSDIATDWNFAISCAKTPLVTIAHQDDIYKPDFISRTIESLNGTKRPLIAFTDYGEMRGSQEVIYNKLLNIKRIMLLPLRLKALWPSRFVRRRILSFGSPICCPSVTFVPANLPEKLFIPGYLGGIDWQAWERFSRLKGEYVFVNEVLMLHRIHPDSATTSIIEGHQRSEEDFEMFCRFWPKWIAGIIAHYYRKGEKQNEL